MSQKAVRIVAIVLLVVVGIAVAAGVSYFMQQRRIEQLEAQLRQRDTVLQSLTEKYNALQSQLAPQSAAGATAGQPGDSATPTEAEPSKPKPEPTTSRQFAFVRKATNKNNKLSLVVDFAQFLTGSAAADAAAAAGDESPPPNDYYISNTSPKLRTFGVAKTAKFVIAGGDPNDTTTLSATEFCDAIIAGDEDITEPAYWFVITNGVITSGEEQWTP